MSLRVATLLILLAALAVPLGAEPDARVAVIVHAQRAEVPSRSELARIYLKKRRFWSNGDPIVPINRDGASPARDRFDREVLGQRAKRWLGYWNRQYFQGVLPPATLASDRAVKRFVALEPKAIGYIPEALVDPSVRVVLYIDVP